MWFLYQFTKNDLPFFTEIWICWNIQGGVIQGLKEREWVISANLSLFTFFFCYLIAGILSLHNKDSMTLHSSPRTSLWSNFSNVFVEWYPSFLWSFCADPKEVLSRTYHFFNLRNLSESDSKINSLKWVKLKCSFHFEYLVVINSIAKCNIWLCMSLKYWGVDLLELVCNILQLFVQGDDITI